MSQTVFNAFFTCFHVHVFVMYMRDVDVYDNGNNKAFYPNCLMLLDELLSAIQSYLTKYSLLN